MRGAVLVGCLFLISFSPLRGDTKPGRLELLDVFNLQLATDPQYAAKLAHAIQTVARHTVGTRAAAASIQVLAAPADNDTTRA